MAGVGAQRNRPVSMPSPNPFVGSASADHRPETVQPLDNALCLRCNYPLRGLCSTRCPECGRDFDPADPRTFNAGIPEGRFARRFLSRPPPAVSLDLAWIGTAFGIIGASSPGWKSLPLVIGAGIWAGLFSSWSVRAATRYFLIKLYRQPPDPKPRRAMQWLVILTVLLAPSRLPLFVRFWISRPSMTQVARDEMEAPLQISPAGERFVGLYYFDAVGKCPHSVSFVTRYFFEPSGAGFIYIQPGEQCDRRAGAGLPLGGGWYLLK